MLEAQIMNQILNLGLIGASFAFVLLVSSTLSWTLT